MADQDYLAFSTKLQTRARLLKRRKLYDEWSAVSVVTKTTRKQRLTTVFRVLVQGEISGDTGWASRTPIEPASHHPPVTFATNVARSSSTKIVIRGTVYGATT